MVEIKLQLWDLAGESRMEFLLQNFVKGASGIVVVFDLSNKESFYTNDLEEMIKLFKENSDAEFILVGNKNDLKTPEQSEINPEDIQNLQDKFEISEFIATSAKTGKNIENLFEILVDLIISKKIEKSEIDLSSDSPLNLKICVIGVTGVGKTSIILRYTGSRFTTDYKATIGANITRKDIQYEPKIKLKKEEKKKFKEAPEETFEEELEIEDKTTIVRTLRKEKKKIERKATVFYKKRMNPMKLNKMIVFLSTKEIYEQMKIETETIARAATGKTIEVEEQESIVRVEPFFPGCVCVPSIGYLDAKKDYDSVNFLISPLEVGDILEARVDIFYKDNLIDSIPTPVKVVETTYAKISTAITVFVPIFGLLFDNSLSILFQSNFPFYGTLGGLEGILTIFMGISFIISTLLYLVKKPKDAKPAESKSIPEMILSVED